MAAAEEEKIRRRLSNAKEEIEQLTSELRKEAEFEKSKIIVDAKKYAEEMIKDAKIIAKNETANAISTVKVAVIDQVVVLAKRRLATEITADQYKNLADSAIKEIEPML
jgi:F0F1-type ATP synthase membrane subunit b/b'